jgi:transcriptional regulator
MYIPASFAVDDPATLHAFVDSFPFATLISMGDAPEVTHIPLLLDAEAGELLGHLAKANPHAKRLAEERVLAIFHGPHAYISPSWYEADVAVPTWNYAVIHVRGTAELLSEKETKSLLDRTVEKFESPHETPWPNELPEDLEQTLLQSIVGFRIRISKIEGNFKLGQNRSEADQAGMLERLQSGSPGDRELAEFMIDRRSGSA